MAARGPDGRTHGQGDQVDGRREQACGRDVEDHEPRKDLRPDGQVRAPVRDAGRSDADGGHDEQHDDADHSPGPGGHAAAGMADEAGLDLTMELLQGQTAP